VEQSRFLRVVMPLAERVQPWMQNDAGALLESIADVQDIPISDASRRYGEIRLREMNNKWLYEPVFGIYSTPV